MPSTRHFVAAAAIALLALALVVPAPAGAAYPGQNGKIFFSACGDECPHHDIYSINPDGSELRDLTDALVAPKGPPDEAYEPSVSADGTRVAFSVDGQAAAEIWIMNADGSNPLQLTKDSILDQQPAISPDGSRVVWQRWTSYPETDIWAMNANGSSPQPLFEGAGGDADPQFAPDGQTVVLSSQNGSYGLFKIPASPAEPPLTMGTQVTKDESLSALDPSVSPDGKRVAFAQGANPVFGPFDILSVGIEGGATTPVYNAAVPEETSPAYSPDGTKMAFLYNGLPMIGSADGTGTPQPLDVGLLQSVAGLEWAPAQAAKGPPPGGQGAGGSKETPAPVSCVVPKLKGLKLKPAKRKLKAAHCSLGKVKRLGRTDSSAKVKKQSGPVGSSLPSGSKVNIKLKG